MEFNEKLIQFGQRAKSLKDSISTEEATKTSIVMPFFQLLGYDVFNPLEFVPEYTADVGIKKGEKVDYAVMLGSKPVILIECKPCNKKLDKYGSQLFRYFSVTESKFAILTNGIKYNFYTDLDDTNKMDATPFLEIDITKLSNDDITELKKFHKVNFDTDTLYSSASELKYYRTLKEQIRLMYTDPSDDFVRLLISPIYPGMKTQNVIERFKAIVQKSFNDFIAEFVNSSISDKLEQEENCSSDPLSIATLLSTEERDIFYAISNILNDVIPKEHIGYKVTSSYLAVTYKGSPHKWICRFTVRPEQIQLMIPSQKSVKKFKLESIEDIDQYTDDLHKAILRFSEKNCIEQSDNMDYEEFKPNAKKTKNIICGQKIKLSTVSLNNELSISIDIPNIEGCDIDLACFAVDSNNILNDEQYFVFYNQPETEDSSIKLLFSDEELPNGFHIDFDLLPRSIEKLVVTASIDGQSTMQNITSSKTTLSGETSTLNYSFSGKDFGDEKAIILSEIYRKDEDWTISIVAHGFKGGLDSLLQYYGGTVDK